MPENKPSIYFDSSPLIDLVKYKVGSTFKPEDGDRMNDILATQEILASAREGKIIAYTSMVSVAECTHAAEDKGISDATKEFFDGLLLSGNGGIILIQPTLTIITLSRSLSWDNNITARGLDLIHIASAINYHCEELIARNGKISKNKDKIENLLSGKGSRVVLPSASKFWSGQSKLFDSLPAGVVVQNN